MAISALQFGKKGSEGKAESEKMKAESRAFQLFAFSFSLSPGASPLEISHPTVKCQ